MHVRQIDSLILDSEVLLDSDELLGGDFIDLLTAKNSIKINDAIENRSTASFTVIDMDNSKSFKKGQPIYIYDNEDELIFSGVIDSCKKLRPFTSNSIFYHSIECVDWHYLADKRVIAKAYVEQTADFIINDIYENYLKDEGAEIGEIQEGVVILEAVFAYIPVSEAINQIAEKTGYWWRIDENKRLYFVERSTNVAPFSVSNKDMLKGSIEVENSNALYRNKQYIKGATDITDPQTETFVGDDENKTFTVGFPIAKVPTVEVDLGEGFVEQTRGIRGLEEGKQWYWSKGDKTITQDTEGTPLRKAEIGINGSIIRPADRIRITYQGEFSIIAITFSPDEIEQRKLIEDGGTGLVEDVADDRAASSRESAFESANAKIRKYGKISNIVKFTTLKKGLRPGQLLEVQLPEYNIYGNELLIDQIDIFSEGNQDLYQITAVEGPSHQSWSNFFYSLASQSREFVIRENIRENQILILLEQFSKTWNESEKPNIFQGTYAGEETFPGVNTFPMFQAQDRVKYLAWYKNNIEIGRKPVTRRVDTEDSIFSLTYLNPNDANIEISHIGWIGGTFATETIGTGFTIDKQVFNKNKTQLESLQIEKTDYRNFTITAGDLEISVGYLNQRELRIESLNNKAINKVNGLLALSS